MEYTVNTYFDKKRKLFVPINPQEWEVAMNSFRDQEKVTIKLTKYYRTAPRSQLNAFNMVCNEIANYTGNDREYIRTEMKKKFGPLDEDGKLLSTTRYNTKQAGEVLEKTINFALTELNIVSPKIETLLKNNS